MPASWSRRRLLQLAAAGAAGAFAVGVASDELLLGRLGVRGAGPTPSPTPTMPTPSVPPVARTLYRSRGDLASQTMSVTKRPDHAADGYLFCTPSYDFKSDGPAIYDDHGSLVWLRPPSGNASAENLRVSTFRGTPVLTWWEGTVSGVGIGAGQYVMADATYTEIARFGAGNGLAGDLHEFLLTPQGTALITTGRTVQSGGRTVWEGVVQEIDVASQKVLFEWHSLDHVAVGESNQPVPADPTVTYDYLHLNSIDVEPDGNLLLSARHTFAVYKVDRTTGAIMWRLNGRQSDFAMGPGTSFAWQHDARRQTDGTITLFDDDQAPNGSRGLVLEADTAAGRATLVRAYLHSPAIQATSQGNVQVLPNGDALVGWGSQPTISEFDATGALIFDAALPPGGSSYRAFRFPWVGRPTERPAIALDLTDPGTVTAYVSWNGATEVGSWELLGGGSAETMVPMASTPPTGFETAIAIPRRPNFLASRARDFTGVVLGITPVIATTL